MCVLLHGFLEEMKCCEFCLNMGVCVCGGGRGGVCVCTRVCPCEFVFMCVCTCASAFPDLCARCFVIRICVLKWHPVLCSQSKSAHSSPLTSTCDATRVQLHLKRHI